MDLEICKQYEIIDAHAHIFPEKIADNATVNIGKFYELPMGNSGISKKLIENGQEVGVKKYLVCSTATTPHQVKSINDFIARECAENPCFIGFGTTHPKSENMESDIKQIMELGLKGVKLHPDFQMFEADSPEAYKIYEIIEGVLPLLIHCGDERYEYSSPKRIAKLHKDFPKLKLQAAHFGGYSQWDEAEEYLTGFGDIKVDVCSSLAFMSPERAKQLIYAYGVENCFYGSDFPMWSNKEELERFFAIGLSEYENQRILSKNFIEFMGFEKL